MNSSTIPLFKGLRPGSSTFYSFSSAMKDMILLFAADQNIRMNFSKFVCLNLPEWGNVTKQRLYANPLSIASMNDDTSSPDANLFFPKAYFQNYIENYSSILDENRIDDNFSNGAESAFWKAMQTISNIEGEEFGALQLEDIPPVAGSEDIRTYKEIPDSTTYDQLVVFVGDLNIMNHAKYKGREQLETYGLVPTKFGKIKNVKFKRNDSLKPTSALLPDDTGPEWIQGREDEYMNSDVDDQTFVQALYDTPSRQYNVAGSKDMLAIDWNSLETEGILEHEDITSFGFNAVMLYYDIWDVRKPEERKRNLYGIVLLN